MGLKSLIQKQVQGAMKTLGTDSDGLAMARPYVSVDESGGTYNPKTRTMEPDIQRYDGVPMSFTRFKLDDIDEEVRPQTDRKVLIASLDLEVVPTAQDYVLDEMGDKWNVVRLLSDPADSLHIIHTRKE